MPENDRGFWAPLPASASNDDGAREVTRLEVDGEIFEFWPDRLDATHYSWVSGRNPGYGFTVGPASDSLDQHLVNIRSFLSMIDPATGYIGDD